MMLTPWNFTHVYLTQQLYGCKSEKTLPPGIIQELLFGELEEVDPDDESHGGTTLVPAHKRKKRGRRHFPDYLSCEENLIDISDEEKVCDCGCRMTEIGREESKQLNPHGGSYPMT